MCSSDLKYGNTFWAALSTYAPSSPKAGQRYYNSRGVVVSSNVVGSLPKVGSTVTISGTELKFEQRTYEGKAVSDSVVATGTVMIPGVGKKLAKVIITDLGEGKFNLTASIRGEGKGGRGAHPLDEL